jgi:tetratricopeptide (TPR) repeat protein
LALDYSIKCLDIRLNTLPENHPAIASTYNNLGVVYARKRNFSKALECYQKSLDISHKILPPTHPEVQRTENNIEQLRLKIENK